MSIQRSLKHDLNAKQIDFYLRRFVEYMSVMDVPDSLLGAPKPFNVPAASSRKCDWRAAIVIHGRTARVSDRS